MIGISIVISIVKVGSSFQPADQAVPGPRRVGPGQFNWFPGWDRWVRTDLHYTCIGGLSGSIQPKKSLCERSRHVWTQHP